MIKQAKGCGESQRESTRKAHRFRDMRQTGSHTVESHKNLYQTHERNTKTHKEGKTNQPTNKTKQNETKKQIQVYILTL